MRSSSLSPVPIMKVAVDSTPSPWAVSMTDSQVSPLSFKGAMAVRGRATRISAPAPAKLSSPDAASRRITSSCSQPAHAADVHDFRRAQ